LRGIVYGSELLLGQRSYWDCHVNQRHTPKPPRDNQASISASDNSRCGISLSQARNTLSLGGRTLHYSGRRSGLVTRSGQHASCIFQIATDNCRSYCYNMQGRLSRETNIGTVNVAEVLLERFRRHTTTISAAHWRSSRRERVFAC
jgi:hypothetical protein